MAPTVHDHSSSDIGGVEPYRELIDGVAFCWQQAMLAQLAWIRYWTALQGAGGQNTPTFIWPVWTLAAEQLA